MDFLIVTLGSHGDVHPFVGIGRALRERGHMVRLATNAVFGAMIEKAGLQFVPVGSPETFEAVQQDPNVWHPTRGPALVLKYVGETLREVYDVVAANAGPETTVVGSTLTLGARVASEKLGLPLATVHLSPICIRSSHAMPALPGLPDMNLLPRFARKHFWSGADRWFIEPLITPTLNAFRAGHGLAPVSGIQAGWWHSPHLTIGLWPEWFFPRQPDYPEQVRLAGFPLYDEADQVSLDAELNAWLNAGAAPIAFTPGSAMRFGRPFFDAAVDACRRLKRRGILLSRHSEHLPPKLPPEVRHVPFAPFSLLLPRCAALVHHGGIGTTAQALRAGVPQIIMPMSHDQFDNAAICRRLGVAQAISRRRFSGRRVAGALRQLLEPATVRTACERVARLAKADRPLDTTATLLENLKSSAFFGKIKA